MRTRLHKMRPAGYVAAGFLAALVIGGGTAVAANGGSVLIGKSNYGTATTSLTNSYGSAASFSSKSGYAPFRVNRTTKVPYLNSDLLDGLDSGSFLRTTGKAADANKLDNLDSTAFALVAGKTGTIIGSTGDDDGYENTAHCPAGTIGVGGGGYAYSVSDYLWYSGQDFDANGNYIPNSWATGADAGSVAYAVCYNPRGAVPGASTGPVFTAPSTAKIEPGSQKTFPGRKP